ncbi:hypothetical protein C8J57DRAFT_1381571 [Mycena rebaudengoi]|nr:hypothetical protein C8J57DRAFT_1381571 [Mycena rebaudengoi]
MHSTLPYLLFCFPPSARAELTDHRTLSYHPIIGFLCNEGLLSVSRLSIFSLIVLDTYHFFISFGTTSLLFLLSFIQSIGI